MSEQHIKVKCISNMWTCVTFGKEYLARGNIKDYYTVVCDDLCTRSYPKECFIIVEEDVVNEVEKELFRCVNNYKIYSVAFKGESLTILKEITSGSELACHNDNLPSYMFERCSDEDVKAIAKQAKKNEDLGVLANVTDEIRKLLDDNHVICHANINRDTKGLVEVTVMLGESV